jgi:hypothetical protein
MSTGPAPRHSRIHTTAGWQTIAAPGDPGTTGPTGPPGPHPAVTMTQAELDAAPPPDQDTLVIVRE